MSLHPSTRQLLKLTTHPAQFDVDPEPIEWAHPHPMKRGPVVATVSHPGKRNAIGAHSGTYSVYRAVALACRPFPDGWRPDFTNTLPPEQIGPHPAWGVADAIVSIDPWGHVSQEIWKERLARGDLDIRPTIAVTRSHLDMPEIKDAFAAGRIVPDGAIVKNDGAVLTTKAAVEPVWYLPGVAKRFGCDEETLRRGIYEQTGGMFPELVTRPDLKVFLPPISGVTVYIIGDVAAIPDTSKPLAVRLHDESYDSELFGNHASTGRQWLVFGLEECIKAAQAGGTGLFVYNRQEGNALGEVSKFLVHNARAVLGNSVDNFYQQQERVTGATDIRLFELSADVLLWLGVSKIDRFVSSSDFKAKAVEAAGISIVTRVTVPADYLPDAAKVETEASFKKPKLVHDKLPPAAAAAADSTATAAAAATGARLPAAAANAHERRVTLTTHGSQFSSSPMPMEWGAADPAKRGVVVATLLQPQLRNAIGTHNGPYAVYRAVGAAKNQLDPRRLPDFRYTEPAVQIGPFPSWSDPDAIVALDPWGHLAATHNGPGVAAREKGVHVQPSIAVSKTEMLMPEVVQAMQAGRLTVDGEILRENGVLTAIKCAIEPVWYLPGIAKRFNLEESVLRRNLFEHTGGMFPELITRTDLSVFLPPIGGSTAIIFGEMQSIPDASKPLTVRVHDECNGSDVFGSDICTCRPYLLHGIEECVRAAQAGGAGIIVYNRKEGRALGEVTKFMVYNARKRQEGGDSAQNYFKRTEVIAGVQDMRFQELMPDPLLWLGVTKIDRFISMSDMKYDAITAAGIEVVTRVDIPDELIPADAKVEIDAKVYAGYFSGTKKVKTWDELNNTVGRAYQ